MDSVHSNKHSLYNALPICVKNAIININETRVFKVNNINASNPINNGNRGKMFNVKCLEIWISK